MMLYRQKYVVSSIRLPRWDYRSPGYYFVTICANDRWTQPFGYIRNGYLCLSNIGTIAHQCWLDIPKHFKYVSLDKFVIMPDHVHGIVRIHDERSGYRNPSVGHDDRSGYRNPSVETRYIASLQNPSMF